MPSGIADYVTDHCVGYTTVPTVDRALAATDSRSRAGHRDGQHLPRLPEVRQLRRRTSGRSRGRVAIFDWTASASRPTRNRRPADTKIVDGVECIVVANSQTNGGQAHFYMETQACVVEPMDGAAGGCMPSTQSPMEMHQTGGHGARRAVSPDRGRRAAGRRRVRRQDRASPLRHRPGDGRGQCHEAPGAAGDAARRRHGHDRQAARLLRPIPDRDRPAGRA